VGRAARLARRDWRPEA